MALNVVLCLWFEIKPQMPPGMHAGGLQMCRASACWLAWVQLLEGAKESTLFLRRAIFCSAADSSEAEWAGVATAIGAAVKLHM